MSLSLVLAALIAATPSAPKAAQSKAVEPLGPPQYLPIEAEWCLPPLASATGVLAPPRCLQLEVPRAPRQYAWGLMQRPPLAPLRGMWFRFQPAQPVSFWMHRTPEPLDMLFVAGERVVAIEAAATPCPRLPCRSYGPEQKVDGVVELAAGQAAALGLTPGSPAPIRWLTGLKPAPLHQRIGAP
ncbi:DUF192 domain-containing protein [Cyanobium sp. ATX 6F1]|uniref:DUF192 domain-containing protein n=1 Tax=Cyanobium sp. ATX 6F1 TaxID=2823702 RepID=UPI0020CCD480|nr:DUF192 domain-containing protein [Cyanobium sp. ATX 6F1]MCP9916975.1 DUF192 domain-containing protein [Cyanobium sp. ATX 6F1]